MEGIAVLHGYDPETDKTSTDVFREADSDRSPWHRAWALQRSVAEDFPGWVWSVGQNERSHVLMTTQNMREMGLEWTDEQSLSVIKG